MSKSSVNNVYRIGAVANITGLSTHTIRAWERRYGMELSDRSDGGTRLYPEASVQRLSLIKALLDNGESISMLCDLEANQLQARLEGHQPRIQTSSNPERSVQSAIRMVCYGPDNFTRKVYKPGAFVTVQIDLQTTSIRELRNYLEITSPSPSCGIFFCDMIPTQQPNKILELAESFPDIQWIVIFELGSKREQLLLSERGIRTLRGPIPDVIAVELIASILSPGKAEFNNHSDSELPPKPIFTSTQLNQLADLPSSIKCECPSHMSAIIHSLNTFEKYCKTCENESPEDAELHASLGQETARARSVLERMLVKVCAHDNIRF
jgi:MerR family transcriptional regulator, light-induced transcriptional regulator